MDTNDGRLTSAAEMASRSKLVWTFNEGLRRVPLSLGEQVRPTAVSMTDAPQQEAAQLNQATIANGNEPQVNFGERDRTWEKYGLTEAPILFTGVDGKIRPTGRKGVFRANAIAADVSAKYTLLPNEEVLELIDRTGFKTRNVYYSRGGNAMHAEILSEKQAAVKVGDFVQLGVMIRNSIDTSEGFGGDIYTYRLKCLNGAIGRGQELASWTHKHIGDRDTIVKGLKLSIERIIMASEELVATYRKATEIRLNEEFAKQLVSFLPEKYVPDYIDTKDPLRPRLTEAPDLWNVFNDVTEAVWHAKRPSMLTKSAYEKDLHGLLVATVGGRRSEVTA